MAGERLGQVLRVRQEVLKGRRCLQSRAQRLLSKLLLETALPRGLGSSSKEGHLLAIAAWRRVHACERHDSEVLVAVLAAAANYVFSAGRFAK